MIFLKKDSRIGQLNIEEFKPTHKMQEEILVTWKEFQQKGSSSFAELRERPDFTDVTLVSEDGHQFKGHKVILGSLCPFFMELLKKNEHPHPLVHMLGVKSIELSAVMDFLYNGESSIFQEHLEAFLALAQKLKLNGLTRTEELSEELFTNTVGKSSRSTSELTKARESQPDDGVAPMPVDLKRGKAGRSQVIDIEPDIETILVSKTETKPKSSNTDENQFQSSSSLKEGRDFSMRELDEQIDSLLEQRSPTTYGCKLCGKTVKRRCDIRYHIEAAHITGFVHHCDICGNANRTRKALSEHRRQAGHQTPQQDTYPDKVSVKPEEVDETVKSMMEYGRYLGVTPASGQNVRARVCKSCGKEGRMNNIMRHIERNHIDTGVPNSCNDCGKTFGTRAALKFHQKGIFCFSLSKFGARLA